MSQNVMVVYIPLCGIWRLAIISHDTGQFRVVKPPSRIMWSPKIWSPCSEQFPIFITVDVNAGYFNQTPKLSWFGSPVERFLWGICKGLYGGVGDLIFRRYGLTNWDLLQINLSANSLSVVGAIHWAHRAMSLCDLVRIDPVPMTSLVAA